MEQDKQLTDAPEILEWTGEGKGDGLVIKSGRRIYTVDKYGNLASCRYKRKEAARLEHGTYSTSIEGLTDLKLGGTYSVSQTEIVVGKLLESNLFGYRFLCVKPDGMIAFVDLDYDDAVRYCQSGNIKAVFKVLGDF